MDLENGDTIYVEATTDRRVWLISEIDGGRYPARLTSEEARILANALLAAVVEAESHNRR